MAIQPEDLEPLEVALLGVLCVGLPPSRAAGSDTFRVDHVTAVVFGLSQEGRPEAHLRPDGVAITPEFRAELRAAIDQLVEKGIVARQAAGMPAAAGGFESDIAIDMVNPDEHPALLDRYLGQLCMEKLFNQPAVYPYLMERYAASGEVWRRIREAGYQAN
ncbi:MAG: hypothetical protein ACM3S1_16960 [Hyphomicrobiales bacterium]